MRYFGFDRTLGRSNVLGFGNVVDPPIVEPIPPVPLDYIQRYDFNGDKSGYSAVGLGGITTTATTFSGGRLASTMSLNLAGAGTKTLLSLPVNSDKITLSLWLKTGQDVDGVLIDISSRYIDYENMLVAFPGQPVVVASAVNSTWQHIIVEIDNSVIGVSEKRLFVNNALASSVTTNTGVAFDATGTSLYIGQHNISDTPFLGYMQDLKVYNRLLTSGDKLALFSE